LKGLHYQLLPEDRLAELMADLFGRETGRRDDRENEPDLRRASTGLFRE
jgi:hypothetical protein